jgi:hypothetical protein
MTPVRHAVGFDLTVSVSRRTQAAWCGLSAWMVASSGGKLRYHLYAVGGFVPIVLQDPERDHRPKWTGSWTGSWPRARSCWRRPRCRWLRRASGSQRVRMAHGPTVPLCMDTGHLLIGGADPWNSTRPCRTKSSRHEDVDLVSVDRVRAGEIAYTDAVRNLRYRPLGGGGRVADRHGAASGILARRGIC